MDYRIQLPDQLRAHLRSLRKQRGLTQAQLGQRLGVGQVRVAEIEAKPGLVSVDQLLKVLSALGAGLVLRDVDGSSVPSAAIEAQAQHSLDSAGRPPSRKKSRSTSATVRSTAPSLRIPAKKGSW